MGWQRATRAAAQVPDAGVLRVDPGRPGLPSWEVCTVDMNPERAELPGATPLPPSSPWWDQELDLLLPCSISGLIDPEMASALQVKAIVPAANAPFQQPEIATKIGLEAVWR